MSKSRHLLDCAALLLLFKQKPWDLWELPSPSSDGPDRVPQAGLEPATSTFVVSRSNPLSYQGKCTAFTPTKLPRRGGISAPGADHRAESERGPPSS